MPLLLTICAVLAWASCATFDLSRRAKLEVPYLEFGHPVVGENRLDLEIRRPRSGPLLALLEGVSHDGARFRSERALRMPKSGRGRFELGYTVTEPGLYTVSLRIYDLKQAKIVHHSDDYQVGVLPAWEFTHDRSFYSSEPAIRFRSRLNRTDAPAATIVVSLEQGDSTVARAVLEGTRREVEGSIGAAQLSTGQYRLAARLHREDGHRDSIFLTVRKFPPALQEVKVDLFTKALMRNGHPFFPIGIYWLRTETLAEARRLRFNSGDYYYKLDESEIGELMEVAREEKIGILVELSNHLRHREAPDTSAIYEKVLRYRTHPALLAWYLVDEPADAGVRPEHTIELYNRIRQLDPYHPVYLVNNRPQTFADYLAASDIVGIDPYPVPIYPISRVSDYAVRANWVSMSQKPVWLVAQAFGGVEHWPRAPTAAELRNMVYQGLVQGTRGVFFYRFCSENERHIQPERLWLEVQELARELELLAPILLSDDRTLQARRVGGEGHVQIMIRQQAFQYYLFAVNPTHGIRRAEYRIEGLAPITAVEEVSGSPALTIGPDGQLLLELGPLGAGVYRLLTAGV